MIWKIFLALILAFQQCESWNKPKISSTTHKVFKVKQVDRSEFDESDRYLTVDAGRTVVLTCEVAGGQQVNWTTPRPRLDQRIVSRNNKLSIINAIYSDTGGYSCRFESEKHLPSVSITAGQKAGRWRTECMFTSETSSISLSSPATSCRPMSTRTPPPPPGHTRAEP